MNITYSDDIIRVVVLDISGVYAQIFNEIYCKESEYSAIVSKFGVSSKYKVVKI
mgnify:FL=1